MPEQLKRTVAGAMTATLMIIPEQTKELLSYVLHFQEEPAANSSIEAGSGSYIQTALLGLITWLGFRGNEQSNKGMLSPTQYGMKSLVLSLSPLKPELG